MHIGRAVTAEPGKPGEALPEKRPCSEPEKTGCPSR